MLALLRGLETLVTVDSLFFAHRERACRLGGQAGKHGEQVVLCMLSIEHGLGNRALTRVRVW